MTAKYIKMHKITDRTTLKIIPKAEYSVDFITKRMTECYAKVKKMKGQLVIKDINLGILADVVDSKVDDGHWHQIEPVVFIKPTYAVEPFYDESVLEKKK